MQDKIIEALRRNANDDAVSLAREWVAAEPQQAQAHRWLALALQQDNQLEQAQASLDQALALAPEEAALHLQHAGLLLALRQLEAADQALDRSTALNPNEFSAYLMQAHLALGREDIDEADRLIRLAERVDPDSPELGAVQGMVALRRGELDRALGVLSAAVERLPRDPRLLYALGFAYLGKDMPAFAEQAFRRVLELVPDNQALRGLLVQLALRQGHVDNAAEVMREVLASKGGDTPGLRRLAGELELASGQPLQALEHLRPLLSQLPGDRGTLQMLLVAWQRLGREEEASAALDAALEAHPQLHDLWLARLAIPAVGSPEAVAVVERWLSAMPDHVPALEARMRLHDMNEESDAAEAIARRIAALEPGRVSAEQRIVEALLLRDAPAAAAHVQALVDSAPEAARPSLRSWLGTVQDRGGNPAGAVATWLQLHAEQAATRLPLPPQAKAPVEWPALGGVADDNAMRPLFVWGAPGSGVERVVTVMAAGSRVLRADRFGATPPTDGFQNYLTLQRLATDALTPEQLVQQWREQLPARGIADGNVIDWLLWWDNALLWALRPQLPEGRLVVAVRDPRDMFIEWLALGAPAPLALTSSMDAAQWLARSVEQVAELHEGDLYPHLILRTDEAVNDPAAMGALLEQAFGVRFPQVRSLGPGTVEAGHWRRYAQVLAAEFLYLTPVAVRLGYPEA
ncbi:tetratricopeptide repeat protein [Stenotrophomonas sp. MH1]|uniref:Tetratricopeptide repeat protein n=1 Tax=Stenotrophomonas capsici TaxID=3110230 RepID=A0ABU5V0W9_9GAMM|nr:tetratricopeptide repeat protein [Stenotrophomonas sp. MH1]MEA5666230.1 tetratricopeptide repeat protein [Stenotrophomonas sp. MH1]